MWLFDFVSRVRNAKLHCKLSVVLIAKRLPWSPSFNFHCEIVQVSQWLQGTVANSSKLKADRSRDDQFLHRSSPKFSHLKQKQIIEVKGKFWLSIPICKLLETRNLVEFISEEEAENFVVPGKLFESKMFAALKWNIRSISSALKRKICSKALKKNKRTKFNGNQRFSGSAFSFKPNAFVGNETYCWEQPSL